jgi:hypothetical protein
MVDCNLPKIVAKEPGSKIGRRLVLREEKSEIMKDFEFLIRGEDEGFRNLKHFPILYKFIFRVM